ncbi:protein MAIN-LIKE 1-like [Arachis stenosperma]|uniref:protein MAIN-LIKE 1-like n=1 Tax=Arachis stenosperma TaxID=217475 RepID=UPI0025AD21E7|nr:protein MAIN-LIKE 1-like [Arachis stenosperma]
MEQQLLGYEDMMYRLDEALRILRTKQNLMTRLSEQIWPYLRRAAFEYVAYMVEFKHDWSLASMLIERWRPESHTFHLPCGEMTITLQDVGYQLGLKIDGDPVSGCIGGLEQHHQGHNNEELCEQTLGVVPSREDRQSQTKWIVKLTWFHNMICGELEQNATEEYLMRYTKGYIMQLIRSILFLDAFDSQVHIRWLPYWRTLTSVAGYCGARLCWHGCTTRCAVPWIMVSAIWVGASACCCPWPITIFRCYGQMALILIGFRWSRGIWVQYWPDNSRGESKLKHYRRTLNGIEILNVEWTPYADPQLIGLISLAIAEAEALAAVVCPLLCFAINEWHQVDLVVRQFSGLQHILTRLLNIDKMHRLYGRFGRGEWFPQLLGG